MLEPTYRSALSHAWNLVWHHKILWVFGLLSVLFSQFGISNFVGQIAALDRESFFAQDFSVFFSVGYWQPLMSGWSVWLFLIVLLLAVGVVILSVAAEGALIAGVSEWYHLHKTPRFTKAWHQGDKHFWRLLAVRVIQKIILSSLLLLVGYLLSRLVQVQSWLNTFYTVVIFAAGFLVAFVVSSVTLYAAGYIVHDENDLGTAMKKGMMLFRRHVVVSLELSIIEIFLCLVLATIIFQGSFWLLVPSVIMTLIASSTGYYVLISFGMIFSLALFVVVVALAGGVFHSFIIASWIYLFMKMHKEGVASRVMHWLGLKRT